jgi:hypothetical protein
MPFHFNIKEDISEFEQFKSILIIPCRFCPAASSAVRNKEPYIELFRKFLKTDSYEKYIKDLKLKFEGKGIRTSVFESKLLHQFVLCMWTSKRRKKLLDRAKDYEALIVLGCEAAVRTIKDSVKTTPCKVLQGIETEGIMSIKPGFKLPGNISLNLESITPLKLHEE